MGLDLLTSRTKLVELQAFLIVELVFLGHIVLCFALSASQTDNIPFAFFSHGLDYTG